MPRARRSNLPGTVFHLTARTQGQEPWFTPTVRSRIVDYTAAAVGVSDARLLAYAVMSNHLHLILRQGNWPLGRVMQPLLRKIAALVKRTHGTEGHVFGRPFHDRACGDAEYVRNAIVYTNLNPVRAGLTSDAAEYGWSSHRLYAVGDAEPRSMVRVLDVEAGLALFAPRDGLGPSALRRAYGRYVAWRLECDRHGAAQDMGEITAAPPAPPRVASGDRFWSSTFAPPFYSRADVGSDSADGVRRLRPDLGEIARQTLTEHAPGLPLERVRSGSKARELVRVRRIMVPRMSAAGFRGHSIARYLRVSDQCVSNILVAARRRS